MTIQEEINADLKTAMLEKDNATKSILRVVIGEFNRVDKTVSDEKATSILKKMVDNAKEIGNVGEAAILEDYLPQQMNRDELTIKINEIIDNLECTSIKDMGKVMSEVKACFAGQYDGKMASTLVKELLS